MIQRIQTLWLALAILCMALCFMFPVATYHLSKPATAQTVEARLDLVAKDNVEMWRQIHYVESEIDFSQRASGFRTWPMALLAALTAVTALVAILQFGNRVRQMRIVAVAFLLNVAYVFVVFFWAVDRYGSEVGRLMEATDLEVSWHVGAYAPLVSLVLFILAHRGIKRDEAKVRAADRLR